jgi:hypothetical protein
MICAASTPYSPAAEARQAVRFEVDTEAGRTVRFAQAEPGGQRDRRRQRRRRRCDQGCRRSDRWTRSRTEAEAEDIDQYRRSVGRGRPIG